MGQSLNSAESLPDDVAVKVVGVWKKYRLGSYGGATLVQEVQSLFAKLLRREDPNSKLVLNRGSIKESQTSRNHWFWAVKKVSFEVKKGECVAILGRNGAGKSTLLQILCGVTEADQGTVYYRGRFATLLQAGVGFHEELTGMENIFLSGSILGLTREEIIKQIPAILEFSEISEFAETPVKRYSSGMRSRLGFSVAAHLGAEIMIFDEAFATGDRTYRYKCIDKIRELSDGGTTILLVTHMVGMLGDAVKRIIFMKDGEIYFDGDKARGVELYENPPS